MLNAAVKLLAFGYMLWMVCLFAWCVSIILLELMDPTDGKNTDR